MSRKVLFFSIAALFVMASLSTDLAAGPANPSYSAQVPPDTTPFYPGGTYDPSVPSPEQYFGVPIAARPLRYHQYAPYLKRLAEVSNRVEIEDHGRTYEGRELLHLIISSPSNVARVNEIRSVLDRLADPRLQPAVTENELASLPAVAWLGYSIHGDELSGVDAAIQMAYQLAAGTDSVTLHLLDNVIVILDPSENPDGRERCLSTLEQNRSAVPNYDPQAMQHNGVWPWGRTNHYWCDMNRDWILVTQPETRGRLATVLKWHPQLMVDAHEMGPDATFMSDPPSDPINYHISANVAKWWTIFDADHAAAFDQRGWPYYIKEWHDLWYPGYGSAWGGFSGCIGILYEQAGTAGEMVKQPDDHLLTFHEAVNHQFTSSLANIRTLADNRREILRDYYATRKAIIDDNRKSGPTFIFPPDDDSDKLNRFLSTLLCQGIEVQRAAKGFTAQRLTSALGESVSSKEFPAGTCLVRTDQPQGDLAKAILEFDPHLKVEFLKEERRELEKHGDSKMYDVSAWSLPLAFNLEAYSTTSSVSATTEAVVAPLTTAVGAVSNPDAHFAFIINMDGERTNQALVRLFAEGLTVYAATMPFTLEGRDYLPGSLVIRRRGNPDNLSAILARVAEEAGVEVVGVSTAVATKGSYLGAGTYRLLKEPHIAMIAGDGMDYTSSGTIWQTLDQELGIPHSLLNLSQLHYADLANYNVIVFPSSWGPVLRDQLGPHGKEVLESWVAQGGTLILCGQSAVWAADTGVGLSQVRLYRQSLDKLEEYKKHVTRELAAEAPQVDTMALWHPEKVTPAPPEAKAEQAAAPPGSDADADRWASRFEPRGVILRANLDKEDWMTFAVNDPLPVMAYGSDPLLAHAPVETAARFEPEPDNLRLSGLLWPEAGERWAGTIWAAHESQGEGQIIFFATDPNVRSYWWGTRQMLVNAILYGPGMCGRQEEY